MKSTSLTGDHVVSEHDVNINDWIIQVECDLIQDEGVCLGNAKLGDPGLHVGFDGHGEVRQTGVQVPTAAGALLQVFLDFGHLTCQISRFKMNLCIGCMLKTIVQVLFFK